MKQKQNQNWMTDMERFYARVDNCQHPYSTKVCPICGQHFCWECCRDTNVHLGGKYEEDFMTCPKCGHDYYSI